MMKKPIYFDYAATTPVDPQVVEKMQQYLTMDGCFANPASNTHHFGLEAQEAVETARVQVAALVGAQPEEIIWTSGATESDNLAIKGICEAYAHKGKHIITSKTEHKAVLDTCKYLQTKGFEVTFIKPERNGLIEPKNIANAICQETILVSIMQVNNETGVIQDISTIGDLCRQNKVIFHVDAAQSVGKMSIDLQKLPVDLMSFSGHKLYAPKGVGALYVRHKPKIKLIQQIHGGGHESNMRSGTLALSQIVAMGEAFNIAQKNFEEEFQRLKIFKSYLVEQLKSLEGIHFNGNLAHSIPGILNISVEGVEGTALLWALNGIAVSTGSACTSKDISPSYVLSALGVPDNLAHSTFRFSMGRFTTKADIEFAAQHIKNGIQWLRAMAPA